LGALELLTLVVGLAFAGFAKGLAGFGLPVIATPILAGVFGPRMAVAIITIPIFASNSLLLTHGVRERGLLRGTLPVIAASMIGTALGTLLLVRIDQRAFALLIAVLVALFLARGDRLLGESTSDRRARVLGPAVCFLGGVLQGTTSIASPLVGSYFHSRRLPSAQFVFVLAAIFELNSIVQLVGYWLQDLYTPEVVAIGLVGLVPTLGALGVGIALRGRLSALAFRRIIVVLLALSVANLLYRTFAA
jgi:uncharacterized membrane protein YfcA